MSNAIAKDTLIVGLEDDAVVIVKLTLTKIEESGFSPIGGIMFSGKFNADISSVSPEELREKVKDKPVHYSVQQLPTDGWEVVDIKWQKPAVIETTVSTSKGVFSFRVVAEATMAARNMNYRLPSGDPLYYVAWVYKPYWRPQNKGVIERLKSVMERLKSAERAMSYTNPSELANIYRVN